MAGSDKDVELFLSLEQALHRPEVRASRDAVEALLADGCVEFGSSGRVYDRTSVIDGLAQEKPAAGSRVPEVMDFRAQTLAPDLVLVTYRSVSDGELGAKRAVLRSSIWRFDDGEWRMVFHQGTVVPRG